MNICSRIREARSAGKVTCEIYHGQRVIDRKPRFKSLGFGNPSGWENELTAQEAISYLTEVLSTHLDSDREVMEKLEATELAEQFISALPKESKLFSNCYYSSPEPLSHSFMDTGVFSDKDGVTGILWIEDEQET